MEFLELYGEKIDRELGSADRTALFTTARRKQAINDAQRAFTRDTECLLRDGLVVLSDEVAEFDLEVAFSDFWFLASRGGLELSQDDGTGTVTYYSGDDFSERTIAWLNREAPNWRGADPGQPECWYTRSDGGRLYLGLYPAPDITSGYVWTLRVPYVAQPTDLSADTDTPFTVNSNAALRLRPWHQALVHYAAAQLELLRRDRQAHDLQLQRYATYVADYLSRNRPRGGRTVTFARDYRGEVSRALTGAQMDPRR